MRKEQWLYYANGGPGPGPGDDRDVHLEFDHRIPVAEGGEDTIDNAQWLCSPCHKPKTQAEAKRGRARRRRGNRPPRVHTSEVLVGG